MIGAVRPDGVPPDRPALWISFLFWALGTPALVAGGLGFVWVCYWLAGSSGMMPKVDVDTGYVILSLCAIGLIYPVLLVVWIGELRTGLKARRAWEAMTPEERAARAVSVTLAKPRRGRRARRDA